MPETVLLWPRPGGIPLRVAPRRDARLRSPGSVPTGRGVRVLRWVGYALLAVVVVLWAAGMLGFSGYLTYRGVVTAVHGRPSALAGPLLWWGIIFMIFVGFPMMRRRWPDAITDGDGDSAGGD